MNKYSNSNSTIHIVHTVTKILQAASQPNNWAAPIIIHFMSRYRFSGLIYWQHVPDIIISSKSFCMSYSYWIQKEILHLCFWITDNIFSVSETFREQISL